MNELALFAGAGGGILGGKLLGWRTVCAVECESYAASVLAARQNDGVLQAFPIWDDVRTFDGNAWRGVVDVVSGGFPCQDISVAGKGAGIIGERSGLWTHMARIIGEVRPRFVFVENSPALLTRGLGVVLGDLASLGYDCKWRVLGAVDVGANHKRDRLWIVANAKRAGARWSSDTRIAFDPNQSGEGLEEGESGRPNRDGMANSEIFYAQGLKDGSRQIKFGGSGWWGIEPDVGRVVDGVAARVDRLKAIGNGQVPLCAATAWRMLTQ
jgi:DNA (cytosine-5)-methyltransferase 1